MSGRHFLNKIHSRRSHARPRLAPTTANLLKMLASCVVQPFSAMARTGAQAMALAVSEPNEEDPPANPSHPACAQFAASDYCHESWQLHLAQLKHRAETHWGTCAHRRLCGVVPVVCEQRCLAVVKLAGPATMNKSELSRGLEMLQLLVRDFVESHSAFLRRVPGGIVIEPPNAARSSSPPASRKASPPSTHPQILRALDYISSHLADPRLNVAKAASELVIHPNYLSQLFVEQMGQRMCRYITEQRLARAKTLLATTDWQIKRVALETGFANPNWFSHVFASLSGMSPGDFRKASQTK